MGKGKNFGWAAAVYLFGLSVLYRGKYERADPVVLSQAGIRSTLSRAAYLSSSRLTEVRAERQRQIARSRAGN